MVVWSCLSLKLLALLVVPCSAAEMDLASASRLPAGRYVLGPVEPLGTADPRELGPIWIGIEPQFPTGRGHLGIHLDPSANHNANSGTLGCVGLIRWDDMQALAGLVQRRNVRTLVVSE